MIRNWSLKFHYFTTIYVEWNDKTAFRLYLANLSSNWLFWHIVVSARLTRMLLNYHITRDLINIPSVLSVDFVWWCSNWQMAKVKKCSYVIVNTESKEGKKMNTYCAQTKTFVTLNANCFLNLQDLRLYRSNSLQNLWRAHKANKPKRNNAFQYQLLGCN